jgi:phosphoglycerate dehydrogenase-like enzyme
MNPKGTNLTDHSREISSVLATVKFPDEYFAQLVKGFAPAEIFRTTPDDAAGIAEALKTVDVAVLDSDLDRRFLDAPNLRWVHCDHAGLTGSAMPEVFERGLIVTGAAGRSGPALAQHAFFFALSLSYESARLYELQKTGGWRDPNVLGRQSNLWGKTLGIVGLGHTGKEVASLGKAFGMRVLAYRRRDVQPPEFVDRAYSVERGDKIDDVLRECDVLVLATHLSDETYHLIGARELGLMKPTAFVINMSRGTVIDEPALVAALESGTIGGAGLDVFEQEPLPADAPIRFAPNTLITPHQTPPLPDKLQRVIGMILTNISRYRAGESLLNALRPSDVYTKSHR